MNIYLDDNHVARSLRGLLRHGGHTVVVPADVGLSDDPTPATWSTRLATTGDHGDFEDLHQLLMAAKGQHPGILIVRFDSDPKHNMKPKHIASAVAKLERSGMNLANQIVVLNHWR